jgi:taurine dioxygenase
MTIEIKPFKAPLGAEVLGLNLHTAISAEDHTALCQAWLKHKVLLFREQTLSYKEQITLSRVFGELDAPVMKLLKYSDGSGQKTNVPPEITIVSNIKENGKPIGQLGNGEAFWHTDSNFVSEPPSASLLHAIELPPSGGNTSFMDMELVLETMPDNFCKEIDGRLCKHDPSLSSTGIRRKDYDEVIDVSKSLGPDHPLIRTHPKTKNKSLYLGRRPNAYIIGLPVDKSEDLLDRLWAHIEQQTYVYEHTWQVGDLLIWDNRCVLHRRDGFEDQYRRLMHKTVLKGDTPI